MNPFFQTPKSEYRAGLRRMLADVEADRRELKVLRALYEQSLNDAVRLTSRPRAVPIFGKGTRESPVEQAAEYREEIDEQYAGRVASLHEHIEQAESVIMLAETKRQRDVLLLRYVGGKTLAQCAEALKLKNAAAAQRLETRALDSIVNYTLQSQRNE